MLREREEYLGGLLFPDIYINVFLKYVAAAVTVAFIHLTGMR